MHDNYYLLGKEKHMLKLQDLVTDPPPNAVICPVCQGYGVVVAWTGCLNNQSLQQTSETCDECEGNGWINKDEKNK